MRHHGISDGFVQGAIHVIRSQFSDHTLTPGAVARSTGQRLATLCVTFKRATGRTIREYVRETRMEQAAVLLVSTDKIIKQVWVEVGYNHPSNFDHDFKRHFGLTPRAFRASSIRPLAQQHYGFTLRLPENRDRVLESANHASILLVDDDECASALIATYLRSCGYEVSAEPSAQAGLAAAHRTGPHVILLDYRLPDFDGLEFLRRLRHATPTAAPAVAIFTADWEVFDYAKEIRDLRAVIVSRLCDIEQVKEVIVLLLTDHAVVGSTFW